MKFTKLFENGPVLLELEQHSDNRGFFARSFCVQEFEKFGLPTSWPQSNISYNYKKGTVRGMHYQVPPHPEPKIVRCTAGAICDVVIDLRKTSPRFCEVFMVELSASKHNALYVPPGFAHGFQTLMDNTEVLYLMGSFFHQESQRGVRWNDSQFNVKWPLEVSVISNRDTSYDDFDSSKQVIEW